MRDHDPDVIEKAAQAIYNALADDLRAEAWDEGYWAGWDDRNEDEDNPLPAGAQHDTPNPYRKEADRG